jgi:hypothetical protein
MAVSRERARYHQHTWTAVDGHLQYTGSGRLRPRPTDVRIRAALADGPLA